MTLRTTLLGLLVVAFACACSGKKDGADKQTPSKKRPDEKPNIDKKPDAPPPKPVTKPPRTFPPLQADPGTSTGKARWSAKLGGPGKESGRAVAIDEQGNVAVTGHFSSDADFGDGKKRAAQAVDVYVSKYGPDGKHLWTTTFGGKGEDIGHGIVFDGSGNIVVVGQFAGEVKVGDFPLIAEGSDDAFFVSFNEAGTARWAHRFGGLKSESAYDVAARPNGGFVVTGSFEGSVSAPKGPMKSLGNEDIFVLELDDKGGLRWIKQFGDRNNDFGRRVALDDTGRIVILGEFGGSVSFGADKLTSQGNQDLVVLTLDERGEPLWSKRFGGAFNELGLGLSVDPAGNIALTGSFDNEITFGGDKLASQGESDIFLAKLSPDGSHIWSTAFGGAREDIGYGLGMDKYGNITLGGWFWGEVDFGGGSLTAKGQNKDAFLLKVSAKGAHMWSKRIGDADHDQVRGVAMNRDGVVAVAGLFRFSIDLGTGPLESARKQDDKAPPADVFVGVFEP